MSAPTPPGTDTSPDAGSPNAGELRRWRQLLANERAEASLYRNLAERAAGEDRQILLGIADAEERHVAHWEGLLGPSSARTHRADLRMRVLAALARHFGSVFVLALAQRAEGRSPYVSETDATPAMAADERIHEEVLRGLASRGRARVSGTFRAAVFGANDGLVSNLALVLGVSGGGVASSTVLLTGLAGLLAGALSMGAGEYVSVRSQRELLAASTPGQGTSAALPHLDLEANELALVYRARGMDAEEAERYAAAQLGGEVVDPSPEQPGAPAEHDVVGTAVGAALSSFAFFASGAAVPVLPFLLGLSGWPALALAAVLVGLGLMFTGAVVGVLSGGPPLARALRQLLIGTAAAATTYGLGLAFGAVLG